MKRIILLLHACLLCGLCSMAYADVVVDDITYSLNAESHEASLTKGADRDTVIIPNFIEYEGMQYPVTSIGEKAFQRCSNLKAVTIGHNVRSIGISAFIRCKSLVEVAIPENVTVIGRDIFNHCEALERVSLCEGLTEIPTYAFYFCSSLKEINIPSTIQAIGGVAFSNCNALEKVEIADLRAFCDIQFDKSNISNPVKLAGGFYMDGKEVTELIIPEGVTTISSELFSSCKNITSLSLPASLETISSSAFKECSSLSQISIPESSVLKSIGDEAFSNCDSLKSIRLPKSVQTIGAKAFRHCDNLKEINIPPLVTTLGEKCFELTTLSHVEFSSVSQACEIVYEESYNVNIPNSWHLYVDGEEVTDLTIPEGVTSLGRYQFSKCISLRSVKIPSTMKSIGERAFSDCSSLERSEFASVESMCEMSNAFGNPLIQTHDLYIDGQLVTELVIPAGVKSIAPCAFKGSNIVSVVIGDDVETVGWDAFCECKQLEYVSIGKGMKSMEVAFESCPKFNKVEFPSLECLLNIGFTYTMTGTFGHETDKVHDNSNPLYYAHHLYIGEEEVHHLVIPEGTKKIYNFAFINCESIQSVIIPEGVTEIGKQVFAGCKNLTSIELPSTLGYANIGEFYDCPSLDYIKVHEDNPNMYSTKGNDALIVPYYNELTLGGVNAVIPDSVPYISGTAFNGRANLTSIRIPSSIKEIRGRAFAKCTSLSDIYYDTKTLPKANNLIFDNTPIEHITLHVPADMVEAFSATEPWSNFGQIVALELGTPEEPQDSAYHSFVSIGKWWNVVRSGIDGTISGIDYRFDSKSVVGEHTYLTLEKSVDNQWTTVGLFREENKQVFIYDEATGREYKTYDFSLKRGDTFRMEYPVPMQCEVVKAEYTGVNGVSLYSLKIKATPDGSEESVELKWTEYIGNQESPLAGLYPERPTDGTVYRTTYAYGDGIYLPFEVNIPMWHGKKFVFGEKVNAEDVGLKFNQNKLNYELIPERGSNTYTLHVTGYMWVNFGSYTYVMCIEKPTGNANERKIGVWNSTFGPLLGYSKNLYKVDLRFRGFDPDVRYIYEDGEGEHEVLRTDMTRRFIEEGKVWRVQDYEWTTGFPDSYPAPSCEEIQYFDGDTIVGGQPCKKWMIRMDDHGRGIGVPDMPNPMYAAAVYEEAGQVFIALPGEDCFRLLYDFTAKTGDTIDVYQKYRYDAGFAVSCIVGARRASESPKYKGICTDIAWYNANDPLPEAPNALWMSGVGSAGIYNLEDSFWSRDHILISCTVGDEVLYYDEALEDSLYGAEHQEAKKNRLDFTHVVKPRPKVKAVQHRAEGSDGEIPTGEYSAKELYVNFLPLKGSYAVTLTDASDEVVYTKEVQTNNVLALNTDLTKYPAGTYTLTVENSEESYEATFVIEGTGIDGAVSTSQRATDAVYDLQGRRLNGVPAKGIYIQNGKKIINNK